MLDRPPAPEAARTWRMAMSPRRTNRRRGLLPAIALAILAHLAALLALGWRIPKNPSPQPPDTLPAVELSLLRPPQDASSSAPTSSPSSRARPSPASPDQASIPAPPTLPPAPPAPALAAGRHCEPEDLPLLTEAEKALCRNEIDADKARRLAHGADERAARQVAQAQRMAPTYRMETNKETYYAAVADAYEQQIRGPPMAGHTPGPGCSVKFSGWKVVKSKPPPNSLSLGPCFLAPPQGFLTEESRIAPP